MVLLIASQRLSVASWTARAREGLALGIAKARLIAKDMTIVPTELDLRHNFSGLDPSKAIAEACVGPELHKCAPVEMAKLYHPIAVKSVLWDRNSILWKCGQVHPLKKKATSRKRTEYRDVRLEDPAAKAMGSLNRPHLLPIVEAATPDTQYGSGLHGGGAEATYLTGLCGCGRLSRPHRDLLVC